MSKESLKSKTKLNEVKESFLTFMLQKEQKLQVTLLFVFYLILYYLLTYLYPIPASMFDSGSYVNAAFTNRIDTYRPFGYSQFLITIHKWSASIHFLVAVQYIINAISTIVFVFSIKYIFKPALKITFYLFAFFSIATPLTLYLTNTVLSDSIFTSLTTLWVTAGLWIIYNGKYLHKFVFYFLHLVLLFYLIDVRFTGLIYIPITVLLVFLVFYRRNIYLSIILSIIPILIAFGYYKNQKAKINQLVHVNTFSGFSGWQLANNALHCIPDIELDVSGINDKQVKEFAELVVKSKPSIELKEKPTAKFMWDKTLPLKQYLTIEANRTNNSYIYEWNYLGENVYGKFGTYVILKYPITFAKNYLFPNTWAALYPVHDQIVKNYKIDGIPDKLMTEWFKLSLPQKVITKSKIYENLYFLIPISRLIIWLTLFSGLLIALANRKKIVWQSHQQITFWLILAFGSIYFAFNVYASPFELRYIAPIHLMQLTLIYIMTNSVLHIFAKTD